MVKVNVVKIGDTYYLSIPKSVIDVYGFMSWLNDYDFDLSVYKNGRILSYKRIKKELKEEKEQQTKIDDYTKVKGGKKRNGVK